MKANNENEPLEVYAGTAWQTGMVKSLLENAEIEVFLNDQIMGTISPWWAVPGGSGPVKVFVAPVDYVKALLIVEEYKRDTNESNSA